MLLIGLGSLVPGVPVYGYTTIHCSMNLECMACMARQGCIYVQSEIVGDQFQACTSAQTNPIPGPSLSPNSNLLEDTRYPQFLGDSRCPQSCGTRGERNPLTVSRSAAAVARLRSVFRWRKIIEKNSRAASRIPSTYRRDDGQAVFRLPVLRLGRGEFLPL